MDQSSEAARLRGLLDHRILDTEPEEAFDRLTELAAQLFDAPIALVSLVDAERQWFKSRVGLDAQETPREVAFCAHAIKLDSEAVMVVEDASNDVRFADNPLVTGGPNIRFYAGAVLSTPEGHNLGTLCVIDDKPRPAPSEADLQRLRTLARIVVDEMSLRRALRDAEQKQRQLELAEHMAALGNWRLDLVGGTLTWSDELYRIHGVDRQTFTPSLGAVMALYAPEDQAKIRCGLDKALAGQHSFMFEVRLKRADGDWRDVAGKAVTEFDATGQVTALIGVFQDITDRKAQERALLEARAEAEAATAVKSEFLANMSHELRTPLTSIIGFTGLIAAQPELSAASRGFVDRVADASRALLFTVNDVLDFSKLEAGQVTIAREPTDPARLCRTVLDLFTPQAGAKDLALTFRGDLPNGLMVELDADRVRQVLLNLLANAVKFSAVGGVTLALGYAGDRLRVEVSDTGAGMTDDQQAKLFRRFADIDGSLTRKSGGTGLGLAICKGLVEAMGGEIGVTSEPGHGSCFWFELPSPTVRRDAAPGWSPRVRPAAGVRLLVADDHPANRELINLFLSGVGVQVTEVESGMAALETAAALPFDVILMDLNMPGMDGTAACGAIRRGRGPNVATPILAFSAVTEAEVDLNLLAEAGFNGLVSKPVDPSALIAAVARATAAPPRRSETAVHLSVNAGVP